MSASENTGSEFIEQVTSVVLEHISEEQFGVSELAEAMLMSRSSLLRKVQKDTKLSASQFIRQVRLKEGMKLLKQTSLTVAEISYKVGFGSTSYFIKCFREYYGHPPGSVGKREMAAATHEDSPSNRKRWPLLLLVILLAPILGYLIYHLNKGDKSPEKSIAILPFKNDSQDSSNLYFVNGLMESALSNMQKIEDLRVVSRTSVEKYRNSDLGIQEIAEELNVSYLVEGSGQKIGDQVMLNIQLIEAATDRHLWAEQYNRKIEDIFSIQNEIANQMVDAIKVIVTPEERALIEKRPTDNLEAYDFFLQALEPFNTLTSEGLNIAIPLFEKAVELDPKFAQAYADLAISYYFLDIWKEEKTYTELINNYADKALLHDPKLAESLISKALYYIHVEKYRLALPHLEKALEYNPNSSTIVQMLADHYARFEPNTGKYLQYALKGIQLNMSAGDSTAQSYLYLHLSNALVQAGFVDEALKYINLSLDTDATNLFAPYVKAFILYAKNQDLTQTIKHLQVELHKDSSRLDIIQEVGKLFYFQEKYDSAFKYYDVYTRAKKTYGLEMHPHEDGKIALVYEKMGFPEEAEEYFEAYANYCKTDNSIYKSASMAAMYAYEGAIEEGIEQLKIFATQSNFQYWIVLFYEMDPVINPLKAHPEFEQVMDQIKDRFWEDHSQRRATLESKDLL